MRPTDDQLAAWRALADAATEGPWTMSENEDGDDVYFPQWSRYVDAPKPPPGRFHGALAFLGGDEEHGQSKADAAFIAAAREAVPALLDEVVRLRAVVDALPGCERLVGGPCDAKATRALAYREGLLCDAHAGTDAEDLPYAAALRALLTSPPPAPPGFDADGSPVE